MRPSPDHRRRGAAGGVPRPAHRAQQRAARDVHPPRQQRARGDHQDVHAAAAGRRERRQPVRRARPSRRRSTSSSTRPSSATGCGGSARSSACPGGSRATSSRSADLFVQRDGDARPGRRLPAARRPVRAGRLRPRGPAGPGATAMTGIVVGLLLGHRPVLHLVVVLGAGGAAAPRAGDTASRARGCGTSSPRPGYEPRGPRATSWPRACWRRPAGRRCSCRRRTRVAPGRRLLRGDGGLRAGRPRADAGAPAPGQPARPVARRRRQHRLGGPGRAGPARGAEPAGDPRAGGAAPGLRGVRRGLPDDRPVPRLPRPAQGAAERPRRRPARRVAADRARGRRQRPRPAAADAVDLPARGQPHPRRARDAPGLDGQRGAARRRRALGRARDALDQRRSRIQAYASAGGASWCSSAGAVVSVVAYRLMLRIGRLPEDERVLR